MHKTVLFSSYMSSSAGRRHLAGVYRYIAEKNCDWEIVAEKRIRTLQENTIDALLDTGIDGVITACPIPEELMSDFTKRKTPIVGIDNHRTPATATVTIDDHAVGRRAAEHLLTYGNFMDFGYVPYRETTRWSLGRMNGFVSALARHNRAVNVRPLETPLSDWLRALGKPAAVFCSCDMTADEVLRAAAKEKIRVPQDLSVLGVDDDELFCDNMRPALSSVRPGHEESGYAAAEILDHLFRKRKAKDCKISPVSVTNRASIAACLPATTLVERAQRLIADHAKEGWGVDEVAKALHVSRRLISLRFVQITGESVHEALTKERLKEAERFLRNSRKPIKDISLLVGFGTVNHLKRLFKSRYGVTMREFRRNASSKDDTRTTGT